MDEKESSADLFDSPPIKRLLNFLGLHRSSDAAEDFEQEIQELIEEGEEQGLISSHEGLMISSIFELKDTLAREIMTPRKEMICAPETANTTELINLIKEKGFSRIPIYAKDPDHIIGMIHAKDLLTEVCEAPKEAREMLTPVTIVSENERVVNLLREFQAKKIHLAVVADEFGTTRGLITLEDILEEIVGDIVDEHDKKQPAIRPIDENTMVTDAAIDIEDVESYFDIEFPEGPFESIGGLIIHELGRVPETGATVEIGPLTFHVVLATKRRIITLKIEKKAV